MRFFPLPPFLVELSLTTHPSTGLILSPHVVGWCLQIGLWGVTLSASTSYIGSGLWGRDPRSRKALILFVLFFCTLQTGCVFFTLVSAAYKY